MPTERSKAPRKAGNRFYNQETRRMKENNVLKVITKIRELAWDLEERNSNNEPEASYIRDLCYKLTFILNGEKE